MAGTGAFFGTSWQPQPVQQNSRPHTRNPWSLWRITPVKICSYCGRRSEEDALICVECGTPIEDPPSDNLERSKLKRVASVLLSVRNRETTWQAFLQIELRLLPLK